jgi:hypothetical protein
MARLGPRAAGGDPLEVDGRNQLLNDGVVDVRREIQRFDLCQDRGKEEGHGGEQLGGGAFPICRSSTTGRLGRKGHIFQ